MSCEKSIELLEEIEKSKYFDLALRSKLREAIDTIKDSRECKNCKYKQIAKKKDNIIRCRECRYWTNNASLSYKTCKKGIITSMDNNGDAYCSYGEFLTNTMR